MRRVLLAPASYGHRAVADWMINLGRVIGRGRDPAILTRLRPSGRLPTATDLPRNARGKLP